MASRAVTVRPAEGMAALRLAMPPHIMGPFPRQVQLLENRGF